MNRIPPAMLLFAALACAAESPITGPVLGYAIGESGVRPVYGIPGAAILGPAADLGGTVRLAAAANEAGSVIAALEDGRVVLYRGASAMPLANAISTPTRIAFSPRGRAAILYSEQSDAIQLITGLEGTPSAAEPVPLIWPVSAMAVSDSGRALLAGDGALWSLLPGRAAVHVMRAAGVSSIAFFAGSNDAAFADAGMLWVQRSGQFTPVTEFAGAIALQTSGGALFAATADGVSRIDLTTGVRADVPCGCNITDLEPMRGGAVFRLNRSGKEPLYLYDGESAQPRVVFVPPAPAELEGGAL
ncbi:MAG TPA: hypothetical protein VN428_22570 [Bryobacteraceae bacterium]|nr:hypothetical protein [Bryobacteraceae bacterium]